MTVHTLEPWRRGAAYGNCSTEVLTPNVNLCIATVRTHVRRNYSDTTEEWPEPDTSWMDKPMNRHQGVKWIWETLNGQPPETNGEKPPVTVHDSQQYVMPKPAPFDGIYKLWAT